MPYTTSDNPHMVENCSHNHPVSCFACNQLVKCEFWHAIKIHRVIPTWLIKQTKGGYDEWCEHLRLHAGALADQFIAIAKENFKLKGHHLEEGESDARTPWSDSRYYSHGHGLSSSGGEWTTSTTTGDVPLPRSATEAEALRGGYPPVRPSEMDNDLRRLYQQSARENTALQSMREVETNMIAERQQQILQQRNRLSPAEQGLQRRLRETIATVGQPPRPRGRPRRSLSQLAEAIFRP